MAPILNVLSSHSSYARPAQEGSTELITFTVNSQDRSDSTSSEETRIDHAQSAPAAAGEKYTAEAPIHTWDGPYDKENPFNWSPAYKWTVTLTVCFISILTGLPAGAYGACGRYVAEQFNVQNSPFDNTIWATVSWNMGAAFWPLIFVPMTESSGRMPG